MKTLDVLKSKCCGATLMSTEGDSIYCSRCGGICEIMNPEYERIERMLRWLILNKLWGDRGRTFVPTDIELDDLPDISDIIKKEA